MNKTLTQMHKKTEKSTPGLILLISLYQIILVAENCIIPLYCGILFLKLDWIVENNVPFHLVFAAITIAVSLLDYILNCFIDPYAEKEVNLSRIQVYDRYHLGQWHQFQRNYRKEEQVNRIHYGSIGNIYITVSVIGIIQKLLIFLVATVVIGYEMPAVAVCFLGLIMMNLLLNYLYQRLIPKHNKAVLEKQSEFEGVTYSMYMKKEELFFAGILDCVNTDFEKKRQRMFTQTKKKSWFEGEFEALLYLVNGLWKNKIWSELGNAQGRGAEPPELIDQTVEAGINACDELHEPVERLKFFGDMSGRLAAFLQNSPQQGTDNPGDVRASGTITNTSEKMVVQNASCQLDHRVLFSDVSFQIGRGKLTALIGENGTGKTTLLRMICGLYPGMAGTDDPNHFSYVPADEQLYHGDILMNVKSGMNCPAKNALPSAAERCGRIGLRESAEKDIDQLSTGQRKLVNILRGTAKDCDVLILDEPFANLDYLQIMKVLHFLKETDKIILCTVHDMELLPYFDEVYELRNGAIRRVEY